MCPLEHSQDHCNFVTHTPEPPHYVSLEALSLRIAFPGVTGLNETIIPLSGELSIVLTQPLLQDYTLREYISCGFWCVL
jgi:hypothetical protein